MTPTQASGPKPQTPYATGRMVEQGAANFFNLGSTPNSVATARLQRLLAIGIDGFRADLIAHLAWGEVAR